jgi:hypothetical protein
MKTKEKILQIMQPPANLQAAYIIDLDFTIIRKPVIAMGLAINYDGDNYIAFYVMQSDGLVSDGVEFDNFIGYYDAEEEIPKEDIEIAKDRFIHNRSL